MALYRYGGSSSSKAPPIPTGMSEFEILKAKHKFLREDEDEASTWDDRLARKYYENLYREFAVCDLKHYRSGNFSLRWRTEEEVLDGTGETTCGNSRCEFHRGISRYGEKGPPLTTLELPFAYVEQGENKSALVKVILCPSCLKKLMWKRNKEKEALTKENSGQTGTTEGETHQVGKSNYSEGGSRRRKGKRQEHVEEEDPHIPRGKGDANGHDGLGRRRNSRSRSPHSRHRRRRSSDRRGPGGDEAA